VQKKKDGKDILNEKEGTFITKGGGRDRMKKGVKGGRPKPNKGGKKEKNTLGGVGKTKKRFPFCGKGQQNTQKLGDASGEKCKGRKNGLGGGARAVSWRGKGSGGAQNAEQPGSRENSRWKKWGSGMSGKNAGDGQKRSERFLFYEKVWEGDVPHTNNTFERRVTKWKRGEEPMVGGGGFDTNGSLKGKPFHSTDR